MRKLSLFSGIGGDDLASDAAGIETVCFVERDKYCQQVLKKHWPGIPIIEDVKDVTKEKVMGYTVRSGQEERKEQAAGLEQRSENTEDATNPTGNNADGIKGETVPKYAKRDTRMEPQRSHDGHVFRESDTGMVDIISGGFPCQPHSVAGKRKGSGDERNLWPEFRRIIREFKPRWVVGENVPGLFTSDGGRFFNGIVSDLAQMGYAVGWCTYGAVDVGAWHRRDRVFIAGYAEHYGRDATKIPGSIGEGSNYSETGQNSTGKFERPGKQRNIMANAPEWQDHGRGRGNMDGEAAGRESLNPAVKPGSQDVPDTDGRRCLECEPETQQNRGVSIQSGRRPTESRLGGMADGLSYWSHEPNGIPRVASGIKDRVNRLKGLGNAVVPQQIYLVYKAIMDFENQNQ